MDEFSLEVKEAARPPEPPIIVNPGEKAGEEIPRPPKQGNPFVPDLRDSYWALMVFILGFIFARWVLFSWQGWGVSLFTLLYCGSVTWYLQKKGIVLPRTGRFWLVIVILLGLSCGLWSNNGLAPWHALILFGSAVYWILGATGSLILGKTSNLFLLDGLNALLVIPFRNFGLQYNSLSLLGSNKGIKGKDVFAVLLGLILTFIALIIVFPLLMEADSGGFARMAEAAAAALRGMGINWGETFWDIVLAVPIAAYIFGLVSGCAHDRGAGCFEPNRVRAGITDFKILPLTSVYIMLVFLCTLYIVFIGSQTPYFFSAFTGQRPEGWQVYAEYARSGFFELCSIAAFNLVVLTAANVMGRQKETPLFLKVLNCLLAVLTLVLISTAFSKMALYIGAYGLSMRRLLPCVFMIFLAVISGGVMALQKWQFSIARLAILTGIIMFCALSLVNPDGLVARYNADRYLNGTLKSFDVEILYRCGPAGVGPGLSVYEQTSDGLLKSQLKDYLLFQQQQAEDRAGKPGDSWERSRARSMLSPKPVAH